MNEKENTIIRKLMGFSKMGFNAKGKVHSNTSVPQETREKSNK